jgi:hypothetical protein
MFSEVEVPLGLDVPAGFPPILFKHLRRGQEDMGFSLELPKLMTYLAFAKGQDLWIFSISLH